MDPDLDFERCVTIFLVDFQILCTNERDGFIRCFCAEHIAQGDIFEPDLLSNVVVVRYIDLCSGSAFLLWVEVGSLRHVRGDQDMIYDSKCGRR